MTIDCVRRSKSLPCLPLWTSSIDAITPDACNSQPFCYAAAESSPDIVALGYTACPRPSCFQTTALSGNSATTPTGEIRRRVSWDSVNELPVAGELCPSKPANAALLHPGKQQGASQAQLHQRVKRIEAKILIVAQVELAYLNKLQAVTRKQDELARLQEMVSRLVDGTKRPNITADLLCTTERVKEKIKVAEHMKEEYLMKAKALHHKRYRWTIMYEQVHSELQRHNQGTKTPPRKMLPPLNCSTVYQSDIAEAVRSGNGKKKGEHRPEAHAIIRT